jgi:hypothetical protein
MKNKNLSKNRRRQQCDEAGLIVCVETGAGTFGGLRTHLLLNPFRIPLIVVFYPGWRSLRSLTLGCYMESLQDSSSHHRTSVRIF